MGVSKYAKSNKSCSSTKHFQANDRLFFGKTVHVAIVPLEQRQTVNSEWNTAICLPIVLLYTAVLVSINNCLAIFKRRQFPSHGISHKTDCILTTVACFVLPFYMRMSLVWWRFLKCSLDSAFRILVYPFCSHACCCWFTWNKFYVFVSVYLCRVLNEITFFLFPCTDKIQPKRLVLISGVNS